ncbi:hypothetical protein EVAR_12257_1 [Eumeta japonica]|uniref:Uncharacterized protein n=1 Tax=Eumeta variegata TaxID=151549 RepID=A0A4C1TUU1_EUMVA|nr:hypothetical protein EVAR_12257_1 [Eumeta japonica]
MKPKCSFLMTQPRYQFQSSAEAKRPLHLEGYAISWPLPALLENSYSAFLLYFRISCSAPENKKTRNRNFGSGNELVKVNEPPLCRAGEKWNRPVMVSSDILCPDDSLQVSSIVHVTRRQQPRVSSDRVRGFQPHTTHAYGREGEWYAFFTSSSSLEEKKS